jgi:AraC-like DNA-binding protein
MLSETGLTLGQWRQQARGLVGLRSLAQGASVMEAAMESGFETASGFIQSFRRQFGFTPGRILEGRPLRSPPA